MAKAKRSSRRDSLLITSPRLSTSKPYSPPRVSPPLKRTTWHRVSEPAQDARIWQPTPKSKRAVKTLSGTPARVVAPPPSKARLAPHSAPYTPFESSYVPHVLTFEKPRSVTLCVRRKVRREVIMATGNGGAQRKGRRTPESNIRCK